MISFNSLVALVISCAQLQPRGDPGRRCTQAIQIIDGDHVLERLDGAESSFRLDPCPMAGASQSLVLRASASSSPLRVCSAERTQNLCSLDRAAVERRTAAHRRSPQRPPSTRPLGRPNLGHVAEVVEAAVVWRAKYHQERNPPRGPEHEEHAEQHIAHET
jgi:hypothetical protein